MKQRLQKLGPLTGLVAVFALFALLRPEVFVTADNIQLMLLQTAVVGTAALGMTVVIISGGIDLSVGSVIALSTVVIALLLQAGFPPLAAAVGGMAAGALVGVTIGLCVTKMRLAPFIVTLAMWGAMRGLAKGLADEQVVLAEGGWLTSLLNILPDDRKWMLFPPGVWMMLILALGVGAFLRYAQVGRHILAVGSNEHTARLCGVPVERRKILVYAIGSAFAGLAGVFQFSYLTVGDPTTATGMELDVIAAVVIGGRACPAARGACSGAWWAR